MSPFAAISPDAPVEGWKDLAGLIGPGQPVALVSADPLVPPKPWSLDWQGEGVQMIAPDLDTRSDDTDAVELQDRDVAQMLDLVERTRPGPFRPRTIELGDYVGVRRDGRLVAMAGVRMRPPGWSEISAVCTDPDYQGKGLASHLVKVVAARIQQRSERPFLHAAVTNVNAIRLYDKMGFDIRRRVFFQQVRSPL
jgi:ribosomal protein S18 acetylase RimI-like enzyme